jgi:hypothetical protein
MSIRVEKQCPQWCKGVVVHHGGDSGDATPWNPRELGDRSTVREDEDNVRHGLDPRAQPVG